MYIALIITTYECFHGFSQNYKLLIPEFIEQNILKTVGKIYAAFQNGKTLDRLKRNVHLKITNNI